MQEKGVAGEVSRQGPSSSWIAIALLACAHFALSIVFNHRQFLDLALYAAGRERTPYQYRVLMAWLLGAAGGMPTVQRFSHLFPAPLNATLVFVSLIVNFLAVFGAVLVTRRTLALLTKDYPFSAWASLLVVYMALFQFALPYGLDYVVPYDLPGLLFFSLAFLAIVSRNDPLYYIVFAVGAFNRETILLALVPFVVWRTMDESGDRSKDGWKAAIPHIVAQIVLWGLVKALIARAFADRPPNPLDSGLFETHIKGNLASILKPHQWPLLASCFGFTLPLVIARRRLIADARLRTSLRIMIPLWAAAMFVAGVFVEIRVFGEIIIPMALGVAMIVRSTLRPSAPV